MTVLVTLLLAGVALTAEAAPLSLEEAIRTALARNLDLARAALDVHRQELALQSERQAFDVTVTPRGQVNASGDDTDWRYGLRAEKRTVWGAEFGLGADVSRYPDFVNDPWRSAVKVDLRQPLFRNFGRLVNEEGITAAGERLVAERRRWETRKADLIVEVVKAFETIARLNRQVACDQAMLERADRLLELTRVRERQGRASPVDTLRVALQQGQSRSRLETHRETLYSSRRDLAELLGYADDQALDVEASPVPDIDLPPATVAVTTAFSNRLDYAQAIDNYRGAQRAVKLARRKLQPDVSLVGGTQRYGAGGAFPDSTTLDQELWTVGLAGQMDLGRRRERTDLRLSEVDEQAARELIRIKALSVTREVQQALSAYRRARAELDIGGRNVEAAGARAELARRLFEMNRGDSFAVTDGENAFFEAESALLGARAQVCIAGYELLNTLGTLTETPSALKPAPFRP
jgi:outer membrane protein TolC